MAVSAYNPNQNFKKTTSVPKKKFFRNKYRWYSVAVILALIPFLAADSSNFPSAVASSNVEYGNDLIIARQIIQKDFDPEVAINNLPDENNRTNDDPLVSDLDEEIKRQLLEAGFDLGNGNNSPGTNNPDPNSSSSSSANGSGNTPNAPLPLERLIPKPQSPQLRSTVVYSKLKIKAPIQWSSLEDIFEKNSDGSLNFSKQIEEDPKDRTHLSTPIQRLLVNGVVHMAFSPEPGNIGNSYIVGHSSNYAVVKSNFNYVFANLTKAAPGDEFIVFDKDGRELKFRVFENIVIDARDSATAYKPYENQRVVTLQASVLVNGAPTKRRLVRGELIV